MSLKAGEFPACRERLAEFCNETADPHENRPLQRFASGQQPWDFELKQNALCSELHISPWLQPYDGDDGHVTFL